MNLSFNLSDKNIVTQVNTCPVMSTTEVSSDGHGHIPTNLPPQQPPPPNPMPPLEEAVPDKKKKVSTHWDKHLTSVSYL